jgi:hypothetical protein
VRDPDSAASEPTTAVRSDAGVVGVSGGTILATLASSLDDSVGIKNPLLILAPSISVGVAYLWSRLRSIVDDKLQQRATDVAFRNCVATLKGVLDDPDTTPAYANETRQTLEKFEKFYIQNAEKRFRARLKVTLAPPTPPPSPEPEPVPESPPAIPAGQ